MTHINEDKRKTEGQLVMFDIFNDIDNCPVSLTACGLHFVTSEGPSYLSLCTCGVSTFCSYGTHPLSVEGGEGHFMPILHWVAEIETLKRFFVWGFFI